MQGSYVLFKSVKAFQCKLVTNAFSIFIKYIIKCTLTTNSQTKCKLCSDSMPKYISNPIYIYSWWYITLLCVPHVPMAAPPWHRLSKPFQQLFHGEIHSKLHGKEEIFCIAEQIMLKGSLWGQRVLRYSQLKTPQRGITKPCTNRLL